MSLQAEGYVLEAADGDSYWFFNTLTTVKAAGKDTHEAFTLMEFTLPPSFGPPPHIHRREDEGFYVLEGELNVMWRQLVDPGARRLRHVAPRRPSLVHDRGVTSGPDAADHLSITIRALCRGDG